jgi:hypothetical protein
MIRPMRLPISFDHVPYFRNQFRGDLIITHGVIYYIPHTNVAAEKLEKKDRMPAELGIATEFLGPVGFLINLGSLALNKLLDVKEKLSRPTINQPQLKDAGFWNELVASPELQKQLDSYISTLKQQPSILTDFEYSLLKPLRFSQSKIKNLRIGFTSLRFDTEYDSHDFSIGLRRKQLLRQALQEGGLLT